MIRLVRISIGVGLVVLCFALCLPFLCEVKLELAWFDSERFFLMPYGIVRRIHQLGLKDYYSVISSAFSPFVGLLGVGLGLHYFGISRKRVIIDSLKGKLEALDKSCRKIYCCALKDGIELAKERAEINALRDDIIAILNGADHIFGDDDARNFVKLNAFIEFDPELQSRTYKAIAVGKRAVNSEFADLMQITKLACLVMSK